MPIHGEWRHLKANALLAVSVGVPTDHVLIAANGACIDVKADEAYISGAYPLREVYVDGISVGRTDENLLKDRLILGEEGFISVYAAVDIVNQCIVVGPEIVDRGVGETSDTTKVAADVAKALVEAMKEGIDDPHELSQKARKVVGRWVGTTHRRRPMIVPVVIGIKDGR
jgi:ribonuclease J